MFKQLLLIAISVLFASVCYAQTFRDSTVHNYQHDTLYQLISLKKDSVWRPYDSTISYPAKCLAQTKFFWWRWCSQWQDAFKDTVTFYRWKDTLKNDTTYMHGLTPPHDTVYRVKDNTILATIWGSLPHLKNSFLAQTTSLDNLGVTLVRCHQTIVGWTGRNGTVENYLNKGYRVILNINYYQVPPASPFGTDMQKFELTLRAILTKYPQITCIVIENEEMNVCESRLGHCGSLTLYFRELEIAVRVCKEFNVPCTNGGIGITLLSSLKNYYKLNNKQDSLLWLFDRVGGVSTNAESIARCDSALNKYRTIDLSYVNLHWYEPIKDMDDTSGVITVLIDYMTFRTGKQVVSNEFGTKSTDTKFLKAAMAALQRKHLRYAVAFDGNGEDGARALTDANGVLNENGKAFKNFIIYNQ